jgi:hypothetical protein
MLSILGLLLPTLSSVLEKLIPNTNDRAKAQEEITKALIEKQGDVDQAIAAAAKAQAEVNMKEAESPSLFVSGWRPFIGWVCGFGFVYTIVQPALHLPAIDTNNIVAILGGMLGLGTMRTIEKVKDVAPSIKRGK